MTTETKLYFVGEMIKTIPNVEEELRQDEFCFCWPLFVFRQVTTWIYYKEEFSIYEERKYDCC